MNGDRVSTHRLLTTPSGARQVYDLPLSNPQFFRSQTGRKLSNRPPVSQRLTAHRKA